MHTQQKFLYQYRPTVPKHVYTLGKAAIPVRVEQGIAPVELLDKRLRNGELNDLFLKHEIMIAEFHVAYACFPVNWREGSALARSRFVRREWCPPQTPGEIRRIFHNRRFTSTIFKKSCALLS